MKLLNQKQVAAALNCTPQTIANRIARGDFPDPDDNGRRKRWYLASVKKWLKERKEVET